MQACLKEEEMGVVRLIIAAASEVGIPCGILPFCVYL